MKKERVGWALPTKTFWIQVLVIPLVVLMLSNLSLAQPYAIDFDVIAGGGGGSSSTGYLLFDTLGQSSPIGTSTSTNYANHAGFWHAFLGAIPEPDIAATPNSWDFQRVFLGQSSSRTFTVSNPGTGNLVIGDLTLTGDAEYSLPGTNDHCSNAVLIPTGTCTFQVVFSPGLSSLGKKTATVSIPSNDADSPMSVGLSGRGVRLMVDPEEGTIGTEITIGGSGSVFGGKKGKVLFGLAKPKVVTWGSDVIQLLMSKALPASAYDVVVVPKEPKGAGSITEDGGFTVKAPEISTVAPPSAPPLTDVTITGKYFGTKKGKVYLEKDGVAKACKVVTWTMVEIEFVVPKNFASGKYTLKVTNKVATGTGSFTVTE